MQRLRHAGAGAVVVSVLAVLAVVGLGASGSADSPAAAPRPRIDPAAACGLARGRTRPAQVEVQGQGERTALVHLPRRRGPLALVIALHGANGSGRFMESYSGFSRLADRKGFAVVYPDARGTRWTLHPGRGIDDVRFIDTLLDRMLAGGCIDPTRVSVAGVSNGGGLAALLACESSGRLAAIATVAGGYGDLPECRPDHPLSVLEIHGTADRVVPYHAARGDVLEWLHGWIARDGCHRTARRRAVAPRVWRYDWGPCPLGTDVEHFAIVGGKHAWPGSSPPDPGPRVRLSAAAEAWRFFAPRHRVDQVAGHQSRSGGGEG